MLKSRLPITNSFLVVLIKQALQRFLILLSEHVLLSPVVLNSRGIPFRTVRIDDVLHQSLVIAVVSVALPEVVLDWQSHFRGSLLASVQGSLKGLILSSIFEDLAFKDGYTGLHMVLIWSVKNVPHYDLELRGFLFILP